MMLNPSDFSRAVSLARVASSYQRQDGQFLYQDVDGDFVEFFESRDAYFAEYVDRRLVVYRSRTTSNIIGAKISQVAELLENAPGIRLEIRDGQVSLDVLFMASRWTADTKIEEATHVIYEKVREIAKRLRGGIGLAVA